MLTESRASRPSFFERLTGLAGNVAALRRSRRNLRSLDMLDDRILHDIGLTRADMFEARMTSGASEPTEMLRRARMRNAG